jgi:general secretion pathway protein D
VKTALLILLLTCLGLSAQTPPADTSDPAAKDEILRRALREALLGTNSTDSAAATNKPTATANNQPGPLDITPAAKTAVAPADPLAAAPKPGVPTPGPGNVPGPIATQPAVSTRPPLVSMPPNKPAHTNLQEEIIGAGEIDFPQIPLEPVVLDLYAKLKNRTVLHSAALPQVVITLKTQTALTVTEAIQALDTVLAMNGITMVDVGEKFVKALPTQLVPTAAPPFTSHDVNDLPEVDQYVTHIAQLKYAKPSEVLPVLTPFAQIPNSVIPIDSSQILVIRDYSANVKRMLELLKSIDVIAPLDFDSEVIPIKYAKVADIQSALSTLGANVSSVGHAASTGAGAGGAGRSSPFGTTTGGYNPGGAGSGSLTTPGAQPGANNPQRSFSDRLSSIVQNASKGAAGPGEIKVLGPTKIIADERMNSLLVFAGKQDMDMIKKIIDKLDIVLAQVLIEAIIMEVSIDNNYNVGASYQQLSPSSPGHYFSGIGAVNNSNGGTGTPILNPSSFGNITSGTNGVTSLPAGLSYLGQFGGDFSATVTAVAGKSKIRVLSKPIIQTSHGVMAHLQVGQTVPEVSGTYFGGINGQASSQYQQTFVGIDLQVTPLVNSEGLVVMDITQDVQQLGNNVIIDGNPVPTTTKRTAQSTVSVNDRDTIVLGGMIQSSKNKSDSGIPLLKDIPGLGYLFRSTSVDNQRTELIILIRPTVLPTPGDAALAATRMRNRLPGVKEADAEENKAETARIKRAESINVPNDKN